MWAIPLDPKTHKHSTPKNEEDQIDIGDIWQCYCGRAFVVTKVVHRRGAKSGRYFYWPTYIPYIGLTEEI